MSNLETEVKICNSETCKEEALYHCNVCSGKFCFEHICVHLKQAQTLPLPDSEDIESSELKSLSDMELTSRRNRLFEELKRVQRELDTRVTFATDYFRDGQRIRPTLNYGHAFYADPKEDKLAAQNVKAQAKKQKKEKELQAALKILAQSLVSGKVTKDQLMNKIKK